MLTNQNILLAISGGIAAYKCVELTRRLKQRGANVRIVMTAAAKSFITPLTLQAVSGEPVCDDLLDPQAEAAMGHIQLAKWADLILVAPASADIIARINLGMANDLLTTLVLASSAPLALVPAMNQQMYKAAATQNNLQQLRQKNTMIWGPAEGEQACGDIGPGRMLEPNEIISKIEEHYHPAPPSLSPIDLTGYTITITAGPTQEALDPVRFLSNHSSGKMGYAIAHAAVTAGATVHLISGKVALAAPQGVTLHAVTSALDMHQQAMALAVQSDIFIACAAVADYRPAHVASQKIKKSTEQIQLTLIKNPDIVADVAALTTHRPLTIGFAAETENIAAHAQTKMQRKNLDMICANDVSIENQGFNATHNELQVFWRKGSKILPLADKTQLGQALIQLIAQQLLNHSS